MRIVLISLCFALVHCATTTSGSGAAATSRAPVDLPAECGEKIAIEHARMNLTWVERDTIDLLGEACRGAVRDRDGAGLGACAKLTTDLANWRAAAIAEAEGAARARESGDADQARIYSARIAEIRAKAESQGASACASREPELAESVRK